MPGEAAIRVEQARVLSQQAFPGDQFVLRLHAAHCAEHAQPGSFVHLQCDDLLPMRRPFSIMRTDPDEGWIEILYRIFGDGTRRLSRQGTGRSLSLIGPIGTPFALHDNRSRPLLIGGGVGIPPMVFLADLIAAQNGRYQPLVLMGSEVPFPFQARPSQLLLPDLPQEAIATMPLLESWGIPCRLASRQGYPGCFDGYVTDLARAWLDGLPSDRRAAVEIFACGPHPMLEATARLARHYDLPCQVSLEEFMACAVGGCAGCTVPVRTPAGTAMKRVCVDGPVFDAHSVFT
jgi:dihydroorotate dehydrogenase electron transfer subunit